MGRLPGEAYSPEMIGGILRKPTYKEFVKSVEIYLHGSIHQSVNGDFKAMTAANGNVAHSTFLLAEAHDFKNRPLILYTDPLFYVHHAQLDRLWWRWQQENPRVRLNEYEGKHMFNSTGNATIGDILLFGGFAENIPVSKVMDTQGGILCYKY